MRSSRGAREMPVDMRAASRSTCRLRRADCSAGGDSTPAWLTLLVVACTVLPFLLLARGIERAGAGPASLLTLVGPPLTVVAAYFLLGERLVPVQIGGALLVLASISFLKLRDHQRARLAQRRADASPAAEPIPVDPVAT